MVPFEHSCIYDFKKVSFFFFPFLFFFLFNGISTPSLKGYRPKSIHPISAHYLNSSNLLVLFDLCDGRSTPYGLFNIKILSICKCSIIAISLYFQSSIVITVSMIIICLLTHNCMQTLLVFDRNNH